MNPDLPRGPAGRLALAAYHLVGLPCAALLHAVPVATVRVFSACADAADPSAVRCFLSNLERVAPRLTAARRRSVARSMQRARVRTILEMIAAPARSASWLRRQVQVHGLEALRASASSGAGAVVVWNHVGIPDVGIRTLAAHGLPTTAHADRPLGPLLWRGVIRSRAGQGVHYRPRTSGTAPLLEALRRGELAGIAWDGYQPRGERDAARGLDAAVALSRRSGAPLWRARCLPTDHGFELFLEGPVAAPRGAACTLRLKRALVEAEGRLIATHLDHWGLCRELRWDEPAAFGAEPARRADSPATARPCEPARSAPETTPCASRS
ncbi:MAG: hypothetical protein HZB25_09040 [Candidatus Eisenbacteria bacterium]|nr:hypothetical protein [Candidatus Eisenbacteria bacterium]